MTNRSIPFRQNTSVRRALQSAFAEEVQKAQERVYERMISPENILRYSHGTVWKHPANEHSEDGSMQEHGAEVAIPFDRIVEGDLSLIDESIGKLSSLMEAEFKMSLYTLMNDTCEKSGNVVSAKETGLAEAFATMLEAIEFSVDKSGRVSLPQMHTADPEAFLKALEAEPSAYQQRIEEIREKKSKQALQREAERKSKFKREPK